MEKFNLFEPEDLKQIPLFYSNIYKMKIDLVDSIENGVATSTCSVIHKSNAYHRYIGSVRVGKLRIEEFRNAEK